PAERLDAEKARAERRSRLAFELVGILVPERKSARHGPLAWLRSAFEHKGVGRIKPDGAQEFHLDFGAPVAGSSHEGIASIAPSLSRSTSTLPIRRTRRSPVSSMSRRTP